MGTVRPMPNPGDVFTDVRDDDRTMRVSYHADPGVVVVSLWAGRLCRASFRLAADDATRLIDALGHAVAQTDDGALDAATGSAGGSVPGVACA